jgi:hypothetical protein
LRDGVCVDEALEVAMTVRMSKTGAAVALALLAAACGQQGQQATTSGSVEVNGKPVAISQLERESAQAEKAAQKGSRVLAPAGMPSLLPASVGGYARTDLKSSLGPEPGMARTSARYVKGTSAFVLELTDFAVIGGVGASDDARGVATEHKTATGYEKITTAGGRMVTEQWDTASTSGRYAIVAAERFAISAEGSADSVAVLKAAVETVNAARLRALAG